MFAARALSQIKQPVIEPGFIASTIQITAIIAIYNLQLSSACIFHFFIETYFALMKGDRLAALESNVFSPNNRCEAREQKHSLCSSPPSLFRTQLGACSPAFGDAGTSAVGRGGLSGAPRLFLRGSALPNFFCLILPSCRLGWGEPPPHVRGPAVLASQVVFFLYHGAWFLLP